MSDAHVPRLTATGNSTHAADGASLVTYLPLGLITGARQIFNRLGLSGSLLRMIEKRHGADARAAALLGI